MPRQPISALLPLGLAALLLPGCAWFDQQPAPVQQLAVADVHFADELARSPSPWPTERWWKRYADTQLDQLIDQALSTAPSLAAIQARVDQARSQAHLVASATSLQVTTFALLNRQKPSSNGFLGPYAENHPQLGLTGPWYTEGTLGAVGSLDLDFWGRNRAALAAALDTEQARRAEAAQAQVELVIAITRTYFSLQSTWKLQGLLQRSEQILRLNVQAHQGKLDAGLEGRLPLADAQRRLLAAQRQRVAADSAADELHNDLGALIGATRRVPLRSVELPDSALGVPADLPYALLHHRADLQAMSAAIRASLGEVEMARAAFYPSFDIKAFFGLDSLHLSQLFKHDSQQLNLLPGVTLPLFDGGRLRANLQAAHAINAAFVQRYNQAVLDAVRDVANRGARLQSLEQDWQLQQQRLEATQLDQRALQAAYSQGLGSRVSAAEGELPVLAERVALLSLESQRLTQSLGLIEALGGGYDTAQRNTASR